MYTKYRKGAYLNKNERLSAFSDLSQHPGRVHVSSLPLQSSAFRSIASMLRNQFEQSVARLRQPYELFVAAADVGVGFFGNPAVGGFDLGGFKHALDRQ